MKDLVSIITPTYNSEKYIRETVDSILNQSYSNWELLITDDCSTDKTVEILTEYVKKDDRIKLFQLEKNSGSGIARNFSIEKAAGTFIAFLDSDDLWHKDKLSIHIKFMKKNDAAFSYTSYNYINEKGNVINKTYHVANHNIDYVYLLKRTDIGCLTAIYNADKIGKMYMPDLRRKQDYALWLSILKRGFLAVPLDKVLAFYRIRRGSATSNKFILIGKHYSFLRRVEGLNLIKSVWYTLNWGSNGLKKFFFSKF